MSSIIKTRAFVLSKLDYGDSSKIANFYTEDFGRISGIVKGARSPRSKIGKTIDVLNHVDLVFYNKENRDLQVVSQADLNAHFPQIKSDLEKLKYGSSIIELVLRLTLESDPHKRLFMGMEKILNRMENESTEPMLLFAMFFKFFLEEIGYGLETNSCSSCPEDLNKNKTIFYNYEHGFLCEECSENSLISFEFSLELFNKIICLSQKENQCNYNANELNSIISFFEKFLVYHVEGFQELKSLKVF